VELEGVYHDVIFGNNEPKNASGGDEKYTLEGVQVDIVLVTLLKNDA
jgi:hypothetical protein